MPGFKMFVWATLLAQLVVGIILAYLLVRYVVPWLVEFLKLNGVRFPS